ncbi:3-dehydroquinate synthase [Breoghania sp. L-A4]|uniref:3-dehydroquinate synthase n=1 Tax=Breoghania sp. L-A4 TaxID=2304600 RepID=UPI0013C2A4ED|nr:3-dehydroquinate synthase [Breoghania sp. L-A4]
MAVIVLPFVFFEEQIEALVNSAIGAHPSESILAALIGGALTLDVVLPVPSSLVNTLAGVSLGFVVGTLVCWAGMTLGCLFGYWIGATGGTALIRRLMGEAELARAESLAVCRGGSALVVMRAAPVLAEASVIAAGAARYPLRPFILLTSLANLGIGAAYAGIGAYAWSTNSFLVAFAGAVGIPILAYAGMRAISRLNGIAIGALPADPDSPIEPQACEFVVPYSYPVVFTRGLFDSANPSLVDALASGSADKAKCVVLVDDGVARADPELERRLSVYFSAHADWITLLEAPWRVPGGEAIKHGFDHIPDLYRLLIRHGVDRHSYVIAIGGGAVLDAVGFAAATAHRGIRHIRIPTTVLSQNDSGVGVKNAVNFDGVKNYVGTFAPPMAVLNDFEFLDKLPRRERIAGIAEAIKVALIRDRGFFLWLEKHAEALSRFEPRAEEHMIRRSAELHLRQIARGGDPFESGSARPLDFGHWSAHKLEAITQHEVRHGEAVAIGIALDARYSVSTGLLPAGEDQRIAELLDRIGLPTWHPALEEQGEDGAPLLLQGMREFQEHLGGALTVTLLKEIGVGIEVHEMDEARVLDAISWLKARSAAA